MVRTHVAEKRRESKTFSALNCALPKPFAFSVRKRSALKR
jgi:hypothetical protein